MTGYLKNNFRSGIIAGFLFAACSLSAVPIYVSPLAGSNVNNGLTPAQAKATFDSAQAVANVTEVVFLDEHIGPINITKPITVRSNDPDNPVLLKRFYNDDDGKIITVSANDVTIKDITFELGSDFPHPAPLPVYAAIYASGRNNLTVDNCDFLISYGVRGKGIEFVGPGTLATVSNHNLIVKNCDFTANTTTPDNSPLRYWHGIRVFGADLTLTDSNFHGAYRDVEIQQSAAELEGNTFHSSVNISNPYGPNTINDNDFVCTPHVGTPWLAPDEAAVTIRAGNGSVGPFPLIVSENTITGFPVGIWSGASRNVKILNNQITGATLGYAAGALIRIDTKPVTSNSTGASNNDVEIKGNTLISATPANTPGHYALEFANNDTVNAFASFNAVVGGEGAEANNFQGGFAEVIKNGVNVELDLTKNKFDVGFGLKAAADLTSDELFALENKIIHKLDNSSVGLVRIKPDSVFATTGNEGIQAAIDAAASGDTVYVAPGTYAENVDVNKTVSVLGPKAGVAASAAGRGTDEAIIVPAVNNLGVPAAGAAITTQATVRLTAANAKFDGFTVDGDNPSLSGANNSTYVIAATAMDGGVEVVNNIVTNAYLAAIYGKFSSPNTNEFAHNLVTDSYVGIMTEHNFFTHIHNNTVTDVWRGIYVNNMFHNAGTAPMVVEDNTLTRIDQSGIFVNQFSGATPINVADNIIDGSVVSTTEANRWGIRIGTVKGTGVVVFDNNTVTGFQVGVSPFRITSDVAPVVRNGSISDVEHGAIVSTRDAIYPNDNTSLKLENVSINADVAGVLVHDSNESDVAEDAASVEIVSGTITGGQDSIVLDGPDLNVLVDGVKLVTPTDNYFRQISGTTAVDATSVEFDGVVASSANLAEHFEIEDKITHKLDNGALGFVRTKEDSVFVTADSGSIQDGVSAAEAGDTVYVQDGTYAENVNINKSLTLEAQSDAVVITETAAAGNQLLFTAAADDITIRNFTFNAGGKTGAAIYANSRKNLRVEDNAFTLSGFGGNLTGTAGAGTAGGNGWSARGILMTAPSIGGYEDRTLFVNRNTFTSTVAPNEQGKDYYFQFAVHTRFANLSMGSNDVLDANVTSGVYRDVQAEYSQVQITNNNLSANVNVVQPYGVQALIADNIFDSGASAWVNDEAYLTIRGARETNAVVNILDNVFNKANRAIWSGNARNVVIRGNAIGAVADAAEPFSLVLLNSSAPLAEATANASDNAVTLEGNTFTGATGATGQFAVEFRDTNTHADVNFGPIVLGSAAQPNSFGAGFDQFVKFGVKKENLDAASVDVSNNTFTLPGASAPLAVPTDYFALEEKLFHNADDTAFGRLLLLADAQFVSGGSIQAAIDAANAGDTIYVAPGTYVENVDVNKTVSVLGPKAGVAATAAGRGTDEAIIVPAVNNVVVPGQNAPLTTHATVRLTAKDAIVNGFTVDGNNPGLAGDTNSSFGIASVTAEGGVKVLNNIVKNASQAGVYGKDISPNTNEFAHNLVTDSTIGFMAEHNFFAHIHDNTATEVWRGIYVNNMLQNGGTDPMVIENNTLTKNDQTGIYVNQYSSVTPINVVDNSIDGNVDSTVVAERYGIRLGTIRGNAKVTFENNTVNEFTHGVVAFFVDSTQAPVISNGSISNVGTGVKVTTRDTHFPGNNASLKLDGVAVNATDAGVVVHDSNASGVAGDAAAVEIVNGSITGGQDTLVLDGPNTTAIVNGVNLVNPTRDYIRLANTAAPTLNLATVKFDGELVEDMDIDGLFDLERKITHKVDDTALGFISFRPEKVYVTSPVVGATDSDITRGIASAGATSFTVYLEGGVYEGARPTVNEKTTFTLEGVSLTTPAVLGEGLTLTGTNTALTLRNLTIGGLQANTTLESVMNNTGTVNGITFDNVTIDGNEVVGRHGVTGGQYGGEILIANSHFKNIIGKPAPSPSGWVAFDTRSGAGTATAGAKITTATLRNNTFTNVQGAINLRHEVSVEPRAEVIIENNTVVNALPAVDNRAGGFFKVFGANRLAFIGNTVSGVKISSPAATDETDAYGAAVLTRNVNHIYVSGNTFENNHQAIAAESVHGIPSGTIADNLFKNNNFGVYYPNVADWSGPIRVVNNHFIGQTGLSVRAEGADIAVNAVNNWFGTNDGPSGTNGVSAGVVASPWVGSPENTESHIITASGETAINFDLMDETVPAGVTFSNDSGFANGEIFSVAVKDGTSPQGYNGFVDNVALPRSLFINVSQATSGFVAVVKLGYVKENLPGGYFQDQLVLGTWNTTTKAWEPAVASNSAGTPQFMGLAAAPDATEANLGKYGVDINESVVWAVVDHASEYVVGVGSDVIESAVVDWSAY